MEICCFNPKGKSYRCQMLFFDWDVLVKDEYHIMSLKLLFENHFAFRQKKKIFFLWTPSTKRENIIVSYDSPINYLLILCSYFVQKNDNVNSKHTIVNVFFCGRCSNPEPCIFYTLFLTTELSSRRYSKCPFFFVVAGIRTPNLTYIIHCPYQLR